MTVCVSGATGFVGAHLAALNLARGEPTRITYRDEARLDRLAGLDVEPVRADVLDPAAMRRALRGCDVLFHAAGYLGSRPADRVWQLNALSPRIAVEAAAAADVPRVVLTSSVAAIGPAPAGGPANEESVFRGGGLGLTYVDAKHEGEAEAMAAGARLAVEVVVVNASYAFGPPVDRSQPGEGSTRIVGSYLGGRLPALVNSQLNVVDVRDVAAGHLAAAERGRPGERYVLGGRDLSWVELLARVGALSGVHHPLVVLPAGAVELAGAAEVLRLASPVAADELALMAQNWRVSSTKARRELGYSTRPLDVTLRDTIDWYRELIAAGSLSSRPSPLSLAAAGVRLAGRTGVLGGVRAVGRQLGVTLVTDA